MSGPLQVIAATLGSEADAKRILDALDAAGYVCVPREPTEKMIQDGWIAALDEDAGDTWRYMVKSALLTQAQENLEP
jgi:hypothetical protein